MTDKLRVVIPTTDGPSLVRRITPEDPSLRSVICLAGTPTLLPVSAAYDAFVRRPTGVVERDVGHRVFRIDVSAAIDEGDSWQLGLYLAHRLKQADRLAEDDEPAAGIVWASGSVDIDLQVGPVTRLADKVRQSADVFGGDLPVLAVVPAGAERHLPPEVDPLPVSTVGSALEALDLTARRVSRPPRRRIGVRSLVLAGLLAGVGWFVWPDQVAGPSINPESLDPATFRPEAISFDVVEYRSAAGGECEAEGRVVDPAQETPAGICAVGFRAVNGGDQPARMWLYASVQGTFREYASRKRYTELADGFLEIGEAGEAVVHPPEWVRRPVIVRGILVLAATEAPQVDDAMVAIDLMSVGQIDILIDGLRTLGFEVRELRHRIVPAS